MEFLQEIATLSVGFPLEIDSYLGWVCCCIHGILDEIDWYGLLPYPWDFVRFDWLAHWRLHNMITHGWYGGWSNLVKLQSVPHIWCIIYIPIGTGL